MKILALIFTLATLAVCGSPLFFGTSGFLSGSLDTTPDILWLKLNDGSGTTATATVGSNGTLVNGPTWSTGKSGSGYSVTLDGTNDYIDCGDPSSVDFGSGNFAFTLWCKPTSVTTFQMLIGKDTELGQRQFYMVMSSGTIALILLDTSGSYIQGQSGSVLTAGVWNHIVFQRNGSSSMELWVNGVSKSVTVTGSWNGTIKSTTANLCIGRRSYPSNENYFGGLIDDVRIYGRALSAVEVAAVYADPQ